MRTYTKIVVFALALLIGPAVGSAYAVTIRDLVALSKEGVSDGVLIALIETDGSRFQMTPDDVRSVRAQGLSDTVIIAMIRTRPISSPARDTSAAPVAPAPAPQPEPVFAPRAPEPVIIQAPPVNVTQTVTQRVEVPYERPRVVEQVPVYVPVYVAVPTRPVEVKKEEPVYWGWGGKRRPDAWPEPVIIK
jgi:hypothetical protein